MKWLTFNDNGKKQVNKNGYASQILDWFNEIKNKTKKWDKK